MRFGDRLRALRKERKFSAVRLSQSCGVKAGAYRRWERNETEPSISQALSLAGVYLITIDEMIFGSSGAGSLLSVDVEPGQQVVVRVLGRSTRPIVKYEPAINIENAVVEALDEEEKKATIS